MIEPISTSPTEMEQRAKIETISPQFRHHIHYVLGKHSLTPQEFETQGMWSKEVVTQLEKIKPNQIVIDSIYGDGFYSDIHSFIPLKNPGNTYPDRRCLYIVGADINIAYRSRDGETRKEVTPIWQHILEQDDYFRGLVNQPNQDENQMLKDGLTQAYVLEGGLLLPALAVLAASTQIVSERKKSSQQPFHLSRRAFMKGIAGASVGIAFEVARGGLFELLSKLINSNTNPDRNRLFAQAIQLVKPRIVKSTYIDIRNIKLGLTAYENARRVIALEPKDNFTSAVVFGGGHSLQTIPNNTEESLLACLKTHLMTLHDHLPELMMFGTSLESVKQELKRIFSEYIVYEIPQNQKGDNISYQGTFHQNEKVNHMIDEVFPEK